MAFVQCTSTARSIRSGQRGQSTARFGRRKAQTYCILSHVCHLHHLTHRHLRSCTRTSRCTEAQVRAPTTLHLHRTETAGRLGRTLVSNRATYGGWSNNLAVSLRTFRLLRGEQNAGLFHPPPHLHGEPRETHVADTCWDQILRGSLSNSNRER
ncbi:hypothetical protein OH76DRAFT_897243 [Lentinus brumalis]|uniref:Uncharacterized protein n=1 Tax=Lentinus brumalis TaxID=2498619 RepID=A0A371D0P4_9APHY|nr:hypothetical protein OH76DRAFT_897243 [Polyporus brumalis]